MGLRAPAGSLQTFVTGGGEQTVILIKMGLSFCPQPGGPAPLIPSKAIVSPAVASLLHGGKCGLCSPETFYPSLSLVGTSWEGLCGGRRPWQLRDKGSPCLLSSALCGLHRAQNALALSKPGCAGGGEGTMGRQFQLLYFGKFAFVNVFSLLII